MERLLGFVREDLMNMSGYSGKKPTIALLRKIQNIENLDDMYRAVKAFDKNINRDDMALEDLVETAYNNLRKEDLGSAPKPAPKPKPKPPKKIPIEDKDITVAGYPKPKPKTVPTYKVVKKPVGKYSVVQSKSFKKVGGSKPSTTTKTTTKTTTRKPMSVEHKEKIAKALKKHHADCRKAMSMLKKK
jgi:hypothetical protein